MKNFAHYTVEDFATEPLFIRWVQTPEDAELSNFWQVWMVNNPNKAHEIAQAKELVSHVSGVYQDLNDTEALTLWHRIIKSINPIGIGSKVMVSSSIFPILRWLVLLLFILTGIGWACWRMYQ